MNKRVCAVLVLWVLALLAAACSSFADKVTASPPEAESTAVAPNPVDNVVTETLVPEAAGLLPHSLYYLATDDARWMQVFRLEKDGKTIRQVTSEPGDISHYAVSPVDGSVAYVMDNKLVLVNADGAGRRVLVEGEPIAEANEKSMTNPVFSLDGQTLAYGYQGLNFYSLSSGVNERVFEDKIDDMGNGVRIPAEMYRPEKYSPDGSKLLVTLALWEGASAAVYDTETKQLVRFQNDPGALVCCDKMQWSADGTKVHSANPSMGMYGAGLWEADPATGTVNTLVAGDWPTINHASKPYLAPDGQLYYFFTTTENGNVDANRIPLQIVRSGSDGATGRTVVREETFESMNEALWAPDASFVIVAYAPGQDIYQGGQAELVYLDDRPHAVLAPFAQQMKWGP